MTSLTITQNNIPESITLSILNKLYETVLTLGPGQAHISGNISISAAHRNVVDYLTNRFNGGSEGTLIINANEYYIYVGDAVTEGRLSNLYGDGIGVTQAQALAVTAMAGGFLNYSPKIIDLSKFTNLKTIPTHFCNGVTSVEEVYFPASLENINGGSNFSGCTKLTTVSIPGTLKTGLSSYCFNNCYALENFTANLGTSIIKVSYRCFDNCRKIKFPSGFFDNIETIEGLAFRACWDVETLDFPSLTDFVQGNDTWQTFGNCSSLKKISLGHVGSMQTVKFDGCTNLKVVDFGDSITSINNDCCKSVSVQACIIRNTTPPTAGSTSFSSSSNVKIFVPDTALSTYLATSPFSSFGSSRVLPLSLYVETDYIPASA